MSTFAYLQRSFVATAKRSSFQVSTEEIESIVEKMGLAMRVQTRQTSDELVNDFTSFGTLSEDAASLASGMRVLFGLDDIEPFFELPKSLGNVNILVFPVKTDSIASACAIYGGTAFIFLSDKSLEFQGLYACARQLGTLLSLSRRWPVGDLAIDIARDSDQPVRGVRQRFADQFALDLLIPPRGLGVALKEIRKSLGVTNKAIGDVELLYLSRVFGISFLAAARQCERTHLLPQGGARALYNFISDKYGNPEVRASDLHLPPRIPIKVGIVPKILADAVIWYINDGLIEARQAAASLDCSPDQLLSRLEWAKNN